MSAVDIEKTAPIKILENRLDHLRKWLEESKVDIERAQASIVENRNQAVELSDEIIQIEAALNALIKAQKVVRDGDD